MDSIDSENINEAEPDFAERKQQALFLSDPAEEVIKELEAENAELKAYHTISEGLFIKIDALKDVLKEAKEFAKGIRVFLITNNMGHIDTDKLIDDINKAIGDKE